MDYYSKYLKYKLKYKQECKQLGGTHTYQYEDGWSPEFKTYTKWTDYTPEESRLIREYQGQDELILKTTGVRINKSTMLQIGRSNTRRIRVKPIDDQANRLLNMLRHFSQILSKNPNDESVLQGELFEIFVNPNNLDLFIQLNPSDYPDAYASRNVKYFQKIILLNKSREMITLDDIKRIINQQDEEDRLSELKLDRFLRKESGQ
jgi:hypothetical protein